MKTLRHLLAALLPLFVLAACGGGGGDDSDDTPQPATVAIAGRVVDTDGQAVSGVDVRLGNVTARTDAAGNYTLELSAQPPAAGDAPAVVTFRKSGYIEQVQRTPYPSRTAQRVDTVIAEVAASLSFDPTQAQNLTVTGSTAQVVLPPNSLRRDDGTSPVGQVTAALTPIDPSVNPLLMPGRLGESDAEPIESFGALQVTFTDAGGQRLNLAAGQTATIRIPAVSRGTPLPATIPLYYVDESTGYWVREGSATLAGTAPQQYYEGTVTHFSTWNADQLYDTVYVNGCVENPAGQRVTSGVALGTGIDYIGNSGVMVDAQGKFRLPVKRNAETRVRVQGFAPVAFSASQDVPVGATDVTLEGCLVLDQSGVAPPPTFPGDDDDGDVAAFAGTYSGTFSGAETGTWTVVIDADGVISGSGSSTTFGAFTVSGNVDADGAVDFSASSGGVAGAAQFSGTINAQSGAVSGTWRYAGSAGTDGNFIGQRN
nr:carboxypeptidase-like regulatory domain-containing protein [uncultured Caldimonas sp.]